MSLLGLAVSVALAQSTPTFQLEGNQLQVPAPVLFKDAALDEAGSAATLGHVKAYLEAKSYLSLMRVEGHVAGRKDAQGLSEQRALAVARWLVSQGVDCKRLLPVGFADTKPREASGPGNTRVEFHNAALRGRPIGGMPVDGGGKVAGDPCSAR